MLWRYLKQILKYQSYRINESMKNKEKENLKLEEEVELSLIGLLTEMSL